MKKFIVISFAFVCLPFISESVYAQDSNKRTAVKKSDEKTEIKNDSEAPNPFLNNNKTQKISHSSDSTKRKRNKGDYNEKVVHETKRSKAIVFESK